MGSVTPSVECARELGLDRVRWSEIALDTFRAAPCANTTATTTMAAHASRTPIHGAIAVRIFRAQIEPSIADDADDEGAEDHRDIRKGCHTILCMA